jgi:hypothetical protein
VEIHWPSGQVDILNNLTADKFYSVIEKEGIVTPEHARPVLVKRR